MNPLVLTYLFLQYSYSGTYMESHSYLSRCFNKAGFKLQSLIFSLPFRLFNYCFSLFSWKFPSSLQTYFWFSQLICRCWDFSLYGSPFFLSYAFSISDFTRSFKICSLTTWAKKKWASFWSLAKLHCICCRLCSGEKLYKCGAHPLQFPSFKKYI